MNARALQQFSVFAMVGLANTAVYYAVYATANVWMPYLAAHVLGYALSIVGSFLLNSYITLRVQPTWHAFLRYPLAGVANVVASGILLHLAVTRLDMNEDVAALGAGALVTPLSFLLARWAIVSGVHRQIGKAVPAGPAGQSALSRGRRCRVAIEVHAHRHEAQHSGHEVNTATGGSASTAAG